MGADTLRLDAIIAVGSRGREVLLQYVSTRGGVPPCGFEDALLGGLAPDGGLYLPTAWPAWSGDDLMALRGLSYAETATRVMWPFVDGAIDEAAFAAMVGETYCGFGHAAVAPLKQLDERLWLMELFHGPTLAFKDYPLQLVGRLFDHALAKRGARVTIIGATSGDTGSAAIEAVRDRDNIDIFILHPQDRVSEVQRRQMTTVTAANVHNIALAGTFDDCQDCVKALFADTALRDEMSLSAVNSINWARIMAQIVYYVTAAVALGAPEREVAFAVPTGNFGNVYAAYCARKMGLPIRRLIIGSNRNDILTRFFDSGRMEAEAVVPSLSPSMDIQISSNFERLMYDLYGHDGAAVRDALAVFRRDGVLDMGETRLNEARVLFDGRRADDDLTLATIREVAGTTGEVVDPHTAVGIAAARAAELPAEVPVVALACAHRAKFPDAVEQATGERPALPEHLKDLYERPERMTVLANDHAAVAAYIRAHGRQVAA